MWLSNKLIVVNIIFKTERMMLYFMKKIFYLLAIVISFFILQTAYGKELEYDEVLGYRVASWTHECVAIWRLPENNTEESLRYYLKLYKDSQLVDERTVDIKIDLYNYLPYIRAVYDYGEIMEKNGYGLYKYSVSMNENAEGILSDEYFHKNKENILNHEFKISESLSNVIYVSSSISGSIAYPNIYVNKENSKVELVDERIFCEYIGSGIEYRYDIYGDISFGQRKFIPKEPGEETIEYVFCDYDDYKIKTIALKYNINDDLKAEYIGYDGILTARDVSFIVQRCLDTKFISPVDKLYSTYYSYYLYDFDGDRNVTMNDATELLKKVLNASI